MLSLANMLHYFLFNSLRTSSCLADSFFCCNFKIKEVVMIFINSESRVNSRLFSVIRGHFFNVIRGLRPANLVTNRSFTSVSLPDVIRQSRSTGQSPWMTLKRSMFSQDFQNRLCVASGNDNRVERGEVTGLLRCARNDICCLGRSMIEMLGVLAIIGVLSVGGIAGYSKAMTKWKTNKTIEQIANFIDGLTTLALNQKQHRGTNDELPGEIYSSDPGDIELFKTLGIIDEEMLVDGELKTPFGGEIDFEGADNDLRIRIYDLPREACMAIATATWGNGKFDIAVNHNSNSLDYYAIDCYYMNAPSQVSEGATLGCYHDGGVPLTPDKAAYGCSCEEASCYIEIHFQKFI